ncbi:MAG: hypothetical protein R2867_27350 [Caldilineaceae bacterium]
MSWGAPGCGRSCSLPSSNIVSGPYSNRLAVPDQGRATGNSRHLGLLYASFRLAI